MIHSLSLSHMRALASLADDSASLTQNDDIQIHTPETFAAKGAASARDATSSSAGAAGTTGAAAAHAIADASDTEDDEEDESRDHEEQKRSERASHASPRRTTLSPTKAPLLVTSDSSIVLDDSAISRRDTVSPQALKSLLQSISLDDASPRAQTEQTHSPAGDDRSSSSVNHFLASTPLLQTPDSVHKTRAMQRREAEERTLSPSEALSMTLNDVAPVRAPASRRLSTLHEDAVASETDDVDGDAPSATSRQSPSHEPSRRATLEPTDAADFLAALRDEMASASDGETHQSKDATASSRKRRQTIQTTVSVAADASPVTRSRSRRATVEPSDMVSLRRDTVGRSAAGRRETLNVDDLHELGHSGATGSQEPGRTLQSRRETLNVDDLDELHAELQHAAEPNDARENDDGSDAMRVDATASRKRKQHDDAEADSTSSPAASPASTSATKKSRSSASPSASPPRDSVVSMQSRQAAGLARPQKTPTPGKQPRIAQQSESETPGRRSRGLERQSLLAKFSSPPPAAAPTKTPLRGILSAKKPAAAAGLLSTPTKSVNFGPPQGAEFNLGSPSTSMTPMLAKDARRLFPLDRAASPPLGQVDEDEDEETSLNTSLLDEADAIDSDDGEHKDDDDEDDTIERTLGHLSAALSAKSPPDKNRRRFSLRGVSPLDNQANARRWRRSSVSAVVRSPVSARKIKGIEPGALAPPAPRPVPTPAHTSVFLSDPTEAAADGRVAYADSSASSDASDDMEITGDFSAFVQASGLLSASAKKAAAAMPDFRFRGRTKDAPPSVFDDSLQGDGDTVELGSLGDLLAESAAYATAKAPVSVSSSRSDAAQPQASTSAPASATESNSSNNVDEDGDDSDAPALGSLGDLARESEERPSPRTKSVIGAAAMRRFNSRHFSQLDEQDVTLDPILEEDEDGGTSSVPSRMSLDTSDDSDTGEYNERRKSLVVNLSSQFESVGSPSPPPPQSPRAERSVTAAELSARIRSPLRPSPRRPRDATSSATTPRISMHELLTRAGVDAIAPAAAPDDHFQDLYAPSAVAADAAVDAVKRAAVSVACKDVVKWHMDEISSWSAGLTDVLASLLRESAPPLFSSDDGDDVDAASAIDSAIKALYELETARVQSGLCQWRTKMETEVVEKLDATAAELDKDVRALKQRVSNATATQQSELGALQELIARETQLAELLDAIDEQQGVQNEYAATVDALETQCAALSLEASVLEDKLRVAENMASERNLVSPEVAAELERQVLHAEEVSTIQASLSIWRVVVATSSHLKLSAQLDDVVVRIDLQIDVVLSDLDAASDSGGFSTDVTSNVTLKRRRSAAFEPPDKDIVCLVQQKLFDAVQLSRFIRTANSSQHDETKHLDRPRRICTLLQDLERYVTLSYRFLRELRALSAQYAVEYVVESSVLWVEFLNFAPTRESKFVVGFALLDEFPFAHFETSVDVVYGPVRRVASGVCVRACERD